MYASTRLFHTSGITLALTGHTCATGVEMIKRFHEAGAVISFDCNYRANLWDEDRAREVIQGHFADGGHPLRLRRDEPSHDGPHGHHGGDHGAVTATSSAYPPSPPPRARSSARASIPSPRPSTARSGTLFSPRSPIATSRSSTASAAATLMSRACCMAFSPPATLNAPCATATRCPRSRIPCPATCRTAAGRDRADHLRSSDGQQERNEPMNPDTPLCSLRFGPVCGKLWGTIGKRKGCGL